MNTIRLIWSTLTKNQRSAIVKEAKKLKAETEFINLIRASLNDCPVFIQVQPRAHWLKEPSETGPLRAERDADNLK